MHQGSAFKEAPKAPDPGRVRHVADVLTSRVPDRFVVREPLVSTVVIGIGHRTWYGVAFDKPLQRRRVGMLDDACGHAVRLPILRANHGGFSHRSAPRVELLPLVFIALLAADIGFIHFDRAGEGVAGWRGPRFADAMQHDPGGRLGHADIAMELHAGNALQAREFERHRKGPLPQRDMRSFQDGAPVRTLKYGPAVRAPVGHRCGVRDGTRVEAPAVPAAVTIGPDVPLKPDGSRLFVGDYLSQFKECDNLPGGFSRGRMS